jgi:hypothetical protein
VGTEGKQSAGQVAGMTIELRAKNIAALAKESLERGWTNDYEVLQYLLEQRMIDTAWRKDPFMPGGRIELDADVLLCAIDENFEIRPLPEWEMQA